MNNSTTTNKNSVLVVSFIQFSIFLLIGFFTCLYILLILIRKTFRENKMNWLSVNISLATVVFTIIQLVFTTFQEEQIRFVPCYIQTFINVMSLSQIMYAYCVASFHRLIAVRYYNKFLFRSNCSLLTSMIVGWIVGAAIIIPFALGDHSLCDFDELPTWLKIYSPTAIIFLPIGIVSGCNTSIFLYIHQISRRIEALNNNKKNNFVSRRRDAYVSKMMLLTFITFAIGWMPTFFEQVFSTSNHQLPQNVSLFFQLLFSISFLGNIILLIYTNQPVRQYIKEQLTCKGKFLFFIQC